MIVITLKDGRKINLANLDYTNPPQAERLDLFMSCGAFIPVTDPQDIKNIIRRLDQIEKSDFRNQVAA